MNTPIFECKTNSGAIERRKMIATVIRNRLPYWKILQDARLTDCLDKKSVKSLAKEARKLVIDALVYNPIDRNRVTVAYIDDTRRPKTEFKNISRVLGAHGIQVVALSDDPAYWVFYAHSDAESPKAGSRCPNCDEGLIYVAPEDPTKDYEGVRAICPRTLDATSESVAGCIDIDHPTNEYWMFIDAELRQKLRAGCLMPEAQRLLTGRAKLFVKPSFSRRH